MNEIRTPNTEENPNPLNKKRHNESNKYGPLKKGANK